MFESAEVEKIVEMTIAHTRCLLVVGTVRVDIAIIGLRKVAAQLEEVSPGNPAIARLARFQDALGLAAAIAAAPPSSLQA